MINFYILIIVSLIVAFAILFWPWRRVQRYKGMMLVTLLLVLSLVGYRFWGGSQQMQQLADQIAQDKVVQAELRKYQSPEELINALKAKVEARQDDPKGWFLLARLYDSASDYQNALTAIQKANELKPHDTSIQLELVQIDFFGHNRKISAQSRELLKDVLLREPNNQFALEFFGGAEFQAGNYEQAIAQWRKVLTRMKPGTEDANNVERSIREAQTKMAPERRIEVTVDLPKDLQKRLKPNDTLFVFAKRSNDEPMPLLVKRIKIQKFPMTVTLTNDDAMLPEEFFLITVNDLNIGARISHSGSIDHDKNDLITTTQPVSFTQSNKPKVHLNKWAI